MSGSLILALDTTAAFGSIALLNGHAVLEEQSIHAPEGFGDVLFPCIDEMLSRHSVKVTGIDLFAAASGPGSFTGVRVGLTAVKGLAASLGRPAAAVSNLAAMATFGTAERRAVLLDARRGEIYGAVYNSAIECVEEEVVAPLAAWIDSLAAEPGEVITLDAEIFSEALVNSSLAAVPRTATGTVLAGAIGRLARATDPALLDANYVRRSDAELLWKDNRA